MKNERSHSGGIGFTGTIQILFIALKLLELIDWSWWWVLAPTWISALLIVAFILLAIAAS